MAWFQTGESTSSCHRPGSPTGRLVPLHTNTIISFQPLAYGSHLRYLLGRVLHHTTPVRVFSFQREQGQHQGGHALRVGQGFVDPGRGQGRDEAAGVWAGVWLRLGFGGRGGKPGCGLRTMRSSPPRGERHGGGCARVRAGVKRRALGGSWWGSSMGGDVRTTENEVEGHNTQGSSPCFLRCWPPSCMLPVARLVLTSLSPWPPYPRLPIMLVQIHFSRVLPLAPAANPCHRASPLLAASHAQKRTASLALHVVHVFKAYVHG